MRKRLKSIYFDRYTGLVARASLHDSYPASRPRRYLFLLKAYHNPTIHSKRIQEILLAHGVNPKQFFPKEFEALPF